MFDKVQIDRRTFLEYLGAVALTPILAGSQEASGMWGLIAKITLIPGRRDEMVEILRESAVDMPGCLSYVVAKDATDENTIWVTEVWDGIASHDASLSLPAVKNAIPRGKAIVSNFEKIAVTSPVWGAGLRSGSRPLICVRATDNPAPTHEFITIPAAMRTRSIATTVSFMDGSAHEPTHK
jgi:quinol monooxygenase YgiN